MVTHRGMITDHLSFIPEDWSGEFAAAASLGPADNWDFQIMIGGAPPLRAG